MLPKERQEIEIEKPHPDPLLSLHQPVTACCSHFLGTALISDYEAIPQLEILHHVVNSKEDAANHALEAGVDVELPENRRLRKTGTTSQRGSNF
jgi:hypothetical protein